MLSIAYPQGILYCAQGVSVLHKICAARHIYTAARRIFTAHISGLQGIYGRSARHICRFCKAYMHDRALLCTPVFSRTYMPCSTCAARHILINICRAAHVLHGICWAARHHICRAAHFATAYVAVLHGIRLCCTA